MVRAISPIKSRTRLGQLIAGICLMTLLSGCGHLLNLLGQTAPQNTRAQISGTIYNDRNIPIANSVISVYPATMNQPADTLLSRAPIATTQSNAQGQFIISDLAAGTYTLIAKDADGNAGQRTNITVHSNTTLQIGSLMIYQTGRLTGEIALTGTPNYTIDAQTFVYIPGTPYLAIADSEGRFSMSLAEGVGYTLYISRIGYVTQLYPQINIELNSTTNIGTLTLSVDTEFWLGQRGYTGPQGIQGERGPTGNRGPLGPTGPQGIAGNRGPTGNIGPTGNMGEIGYDGPQGPIGPTGNSGPTGNTGAQGPQGSTGPAGDDLTVKPTLTLATASIRTDRQTELTFTASELTDVTGFYVSWSTTLNASLDTWYANSLYIPLASCTVTGLDITIPGTACVLFAPPVGSYYIRVAAVKNNQNIAKFSNERIITIQPGFISRWATAITSVGMELDIYNNLYVTDDDNDAVIKYSSSGSILSTDYLDANTHWSNPTGIHIDMYGRLYVLDRTANKIVVYDSNTTFYTEWGGPGTGNNQYNEPYDCTSDSNGNIYISDSLNHRIQKLDYTGTFVTTWGTQGAGNSQFNTPKGITIDSNNMLYVADSGNNRIVQYTSTGTFIRTIGTALYEGSSLDNPTAVAVDADGTFYIADTGRNRIVVLDRYGAYVRIIGSQGSGDTPFDSPVDIKIGSDGYLYVHDDGNDRIQKIKK